MLRRRDRLVELRDRRGRRIRGGRHSGIEREEVEQMVLMVSCPSSWKSDVWLYELKVSWSQLQKIISELSQKGNIKSHHPN